MAEIPAGAEAQAARIAQLLKAGRGSRRQKDVCAAAGLSDTALSAYENARLVPDLRQAHLLDRVLELDGRLVSLVAEMFASPADSDLAGPARTLTVVVFPPPYLGPVWVSVKAERVVPVQVTLLWGLWWNTVRVQVDRYGSALLFAKVSAGERSVPLRVRTDTPVLVSHGCGMPDHFSDERVIDLNDDWTSRSHHIPIVEER